MSHYLTTKILYYIESNLDNKIIVKEISNFIQKSTRHTCRVFKENTNFCLKKYISLRKKLKIGKELLVTRNKIVDLSFLNGFNSHENMSRNFKKIYAVNPKQFRKYSNFINLDDYFVIPEHYEYEFNDNIDKDMQKIIKFILDNLPYSLNIESLKKKFSKSEEYFNEIFMTNFSLGVNDQLATIKKRYMILDSVESRYTYSELLKIYDLNNKSINKNIILENLKFENLIDLFIFINNYTEFNNEFKMILKRK